MKHPLGGHKPLRQTRRFAESLLTSPRTAAASRLWGPDPTLNVTTSAPTSEIVAALEWQS